LDVVSIPFMPLEGSALLNEVFEWLGWLSGTTVTIKKITTRKKPKPKFIQNEKIIKNAIRLLHEWLSSNPFMFVTANPIPGMTDFAYAAIRAAGIDPDCPNPGGPGGKFPIDVDIIKKTRELYEIVFAANNLGPGQAREVYTAIVCMVVWMRVTGATNVGGGGRQLP